MDCLTYKERHFNLKLQNLNKIKGTHVYYCMVGYPSDWNNDRKITERTSRLLITFIKYRTYLKFEL